MIYSYLFNDQSLFWNSRQVFQDFLRLEIPTCEGKAIKAFFEGFLQNVEILLNEAIKKITAGRRKISHLELKYQCWKHSSHAKR